MHVHFLDPYRPQDSPVHRLDASSKLILTVAFILTSALTPVGAWPVYILLLALVLSAAALSMLGIGFVLKRAALALPFVLAAVPLLFTVPGEVLFRLPVGSWELAVSAAGAERFASIALKSWVSVQAAILLAASTPFPDLLLAFRAVRTPRLLVSIFGMMWRYLFVFADEALRLIRARTARSGVLARPELTSGGSLAWRGKIAGGMAGSLLLRAFERSDRIYMAMLSRGYDGEVRTLPPPEVRPAQWLVLGAGLLILVALLGLGYLFG